MLARSSADSLQKKWIMKYSDVCSLECRLDQFSIYFSLLWIFVTITVVFSRFRVIAEIKKIKADILIVNK